MKVCLDEFIKKLQKPKSWPPLLLSFLFFFLGCSSLVVTNGIPEIESPVYQGRKSFGFSFLASAGKELTLNDDPSARPPDVTDKKFEVANHFISRPAIHFYPMSQLSLAIGMQNSSALFASSKINLLNGLIDDPAPGIFYAVINFMSTYELAKKSGNQNGLGGASGYPWEAKVENLTGTAGFSIGYQTRKKIVPFFGFNYQATKTTGKVDQKSSATDQGGSYTLRSQNGITRVYGIGFDWKPKYGFFIAPQLNYYEFYWGGNEIKEVTGSVKITYIPVQ